MTTHRTYRFASGSHRNAGPFDRAVQTDAILDLLRIAGGEFVRHPMLVAGIARLGERLRDGGLERLGQDLRRTARRHPTLLVVGGVVLGVACARIAKTLARGEVIEGEIERSDALVPREHLTSVAASARRKRAFGE